MAPSDEQAEPVEPTDDVLVEDELLVEEISIDGMCGVY
jgi:mycofactocin precursor